MNTIDFKKENITISILVLLWIVLQFIVSKNFTMRTSFDSELYIAGAENILNGRYPTGRELFYSTYMFILAALAFLNLEPESVIYVHFLASIIALLATYRLVKKITNHQSTATFAVFLYIIWFKFLQWNLIVYTDALFSHMVIISVYTLFIARNAKQKVGAFVLILCTCLLRPTGVGLLVATTIYFVNTAVQARNFRFYQKFTALIFVTFLLFLLLNQVLVHFIDSFIESYQMAEIIYPKVKVFINEPSSLYIPGKDKPALIKLFLFIVMNPIYFLKISAMKGLLFIGHIKPYYSLFHNIVIASFLYPIYLLAIKGYFAMNEHHLKQLFFSFIAFQFLTVSLTSENWDGRFLLPILPLTFILSSVGLFSYLNKKVVTNDI